jgi:hypothetical protein
MDISNFNVEDLALQKSSKPWWSSQVNIYYLGGSLHIHWCPICCPNIGQVNLNQCVWNIKKFTIPIVLNNKYECTYMVILGCICHVCTYFQSPKRLRLHLYWRYIYFDDGSFAKVFCREQLFCYSAWLNWKTCETAPSSSRDSFEWICCLLMEYQLLGYFAKFILPNSVICIITLMPSLYIISLVCQVVVVLSIHPSRHPSIQVPHPERRRWWKRRRRRKNSCSLAICQKLQTNF